jgi:hypothetical protein
MASVSRQFKAAMDALQKEALVSMQSRLGSTAISPRDKGRFRSSWFAAEGVPSREVAPEGADSPNTDAESLSVDASRTYWLSNSLSYAEYVVAGDTIVSQPRTWFTDFRVVEIPRIYEKAARVTKARFDF